MPVATFTQPDVTAQDAATYKAAIDASIKVMSRFGQAFAPHQQTTPDMTVRVDTGFILAGTTQTEKAAQSTGTITAPAGNPRIDRVVLDAATGNVSVVTGTPAASPVAPAIPSGKLPCAQVLLQTTSTSITNAMITDERAPVPRMDAVGLFRKADPTTAAFVKTGAFTMSTQAAIIYVDVNGVMQSIAASTVVTMPGSPAAGTDYAIWAKTDGTLEATADHVTPPTANARKIGGFHYAPGGNATQISISAVAAGTAIVVQTVPVNTWALYLLSINAAGTITVTPAAANATTGYATEALAIAALPSRPASSAYMGHVTVLTKVGFAWIAGTDALAGGASGNVAATTNYYPQLGAAMGLTLSRGTTDTNIASTAFAYYLGGDTTPAINAYSVWDLKFRPACPDPRGMCLVADGFWADIYLLGVDHPTNGSSKYNVTIADGPSPPKIPAKFGGNGTTAYGGGNWWDMHEVMRSFGKRFPNYSEFSALAYGTTEAISSGGTDVPTTGVSGTGATSAWNLFTSKWGVVQAAGNLWVWGDEFGGGTAAGGWVANTGGRGSTYQLENAVLLGGAWNTGVGPGSRASLWLYAPTYSNNDIGARGVCDHLQLD